MTNTAQRLIREREILPRLTLPSTDDRPVTIIGQQTSLLVFVHPGGCEACAGYLRELSGAVEDLRSWGTRLMAVGGDAGTAGDLPFPVLVDEDGTARRRIGIGDDEAALILADPWGEVAEVATFGDDHQFPLPSQLVESSKIVDLSCGECNVPGPEWRGLDEEG